MKSFLGLKNTKRNWKVTFVLLAVCCASLATAFLVGISGNWTGIILCYIAATTLILALVHTWRKVKNFLILLGASLVGFPVFVVLHNVFYGLAELANDIILLSRLLEFLHAGFFIIATLVCPAGFLIGAVGSVVTIIKYLKKKKSL